MKKRVQSGGYLAAVERASGLTGLGVTAIAAALATIVLGNRIDSAGLTVLGYALALTVAIVWLVSRRKTPIEVTRSTLPRRVTEGRQIDVVLTLTSQRRLTSVVIDECFPDSAWKEIRIPVPVLPRGEAVELPYTIKADRRGTFQVGPLTLERTDPFGIARSRRDIAEPTTLIVHPRTEPVLDRILAREFEDPILRPPHSRPWPTGAEFYGMRPYLYGDDPRRIVWRASARREELLVREAEHGVTDSVCLVLDTARASYPASSHYNTAFEKAVSAAASVGLFHLKSGFSVNLMTNSGQRGNLLRGTHQRYDLLDALAEVEHEDEDLCDVTRQLMLQRRHDGHHVFVTGALSEAAAKSLRILIERGRSISIVLIIGYHTDPRSIDNAISLRCPLVQVGEHESLTKPFQHALTVRPR